MPRAKKKAPPKTPLKVVKRGNYSHVALQHRRFAEEYLVDLDPLGAYDRAGYKAKTRAIAKAAASRLLTYADVQQYIEDMQAERKGIRAADADRLILRLNAVYLTAMGQNDLSAALGALNQLGRAMGIFAADNSQKQSGQMRIEDVEKLRAELSARGFEMGILNRPEGMVLPHERAAMAAGLIPVRPVRSQASVSETALEEPHCPTT